METISLLHISDLHRSPGGEVTNSALIASITHDRDKYTNSENPKIKSPDIIIVSGDIIRGSSKANGSELDIQNQYKEAIEFLNQLTDQLLGGNKSRIIVIPGNHDVDFKFSKESMIKIDSAKVVDDKNNLKWEYLNDSINQNSKTRWSWKDLSFYEIVDEAKYNQRLGAFATFYEEFYEGRRTYSIDPKEQFDIFDYPEFNLTIAAFNSCYNNDHLRFVGDVNPECIAKVEVKLREYKKKGRLIFGTWHHNTKGLPYDSNYMDSSHLKNFIDAGIVVGFHGHQHKTELIHDYSNVVERKRILIFSAGTLCGGPKELPVGHNRQYNLIEIMRDPSKEFLDLTLHVREKTDTSTFSNPIWTPGRIDSMLISHHTFRLKAPAMAEQGNLLIEIERLMKSQQFPEAKAHLMKLDANDDFVRKFLVECIIQTEDFELAVKVLDEPRTDAEIITLLNASIQLKDRARMTEYIDKFKSAALTSKTINAFIKKMEVITR